MRHLCKIVYNYLYKGTKFIPIKSRVVYKCITNVNKLNNLRLSILCKIVYYCLYICNYKCKIFLCDSKL